MLNLSREGLSCTRRMRLFISINPPSQIEEYVRDLQSLLPKARMSLSSGFHLTLKFLGEVHSGSRYDSIISICKAAAESFSQKQALNFQLDKIACFKHGKIVRVVYVDLKIPEVIFPLQRFIETSLVPLGFEDENRFVPHITLARVKSHESEFEQQLGKIKVEGLTFQVSNFSLMQSELARTGAKYTEVERFEICVGKS